MRKQIYWPQLLTALFEGGLTQQEIARRCDASQTGIHLLAAGKTTDPAHSLGDALIAQYVAMYPERDVALLEVPPLPCVKGAALAPATPAPLAEPLVVGV